MGIQTTEIVDALINAARTSTAIQEQRQTVLAARLEAVQGFNTRMLSAQLDLTNLRSGTVFNSMTVNSSNSSVMTGSANSNAVQGTYSFNVSSLAQADQLRAGSIEPQRRPWRQYPHHQLGNGAPTELTLGASASSLDDVASAINGADVGVSAYVVEQSGADPYRLIIQSNETGLSSDISLSSTGGMDSLFDAPATLPSHLTFGPSFEVLTAADDAVVTMGGGALTFSSANNEFNDIIPGVSLTASATGSSTLTVGRDVSGATAAITTFVDSLNGAIDYLNANTQVDPNGENSGILYPKPISAAAWTPS